jgi:hypothetical protein
MPKEFEDAVLCLREATLPSCGPLNYNPLCTNKHTRTATLRRRWTPDRPLPELRQHAPPSAADTLQTFCGIPGVITAETHPLMPPRAHCCRTALRTAVPPAAAAACRAAVHTALRGPCTSRSLPRITTAPPRPRQQHAQPRRAPKLAWCNGWRRERCLARSLHTVLTAAPPAAAAACRCCQQSVPPHRPALPCTISAALTAAPPRAPAASSVYRPALPCTISDALTAAPPRPPQLQPL